jgi:hypothetical protein
MIVTFLAFILLAYSIATWNSVYDFIAMMIEFSIIMIQLGTEMSIMPTDYRPSHGGVAYTAQLSTHIAYDELSFLMAFVYPVKEEAALGFRNPIAGWGLCRENPLSSIRVDDTLMTREVLRFREEKNDTNYIRSRHQLRYLCIRVADKHQHTTNGRKLEFFDTAPSLVGDNPITVRKVSYFDALLTAEAFRSRIFRNNLKNEKEVYTDLTTYFPVKREEIDGEDGLRFAPDFYKKVTGCIGITTLLLTENRCIAMLKQGTTNAVGANMICLGGSGSMNYSDMEQMGPPEDFRTVIAYSMARELCEETGMDKKWFEETRRNTMITGFFRWIDRCGHPEFIGITRANKIPFSQNSKGDGDEVVGYEEIPITIEKLEDFHRVLTYVRTRKLPIALSSLMALHRMTIIAGYGETWATETQKGIYKKMAEFLFAPWGVRDQAA